MEPSEQSKFISLFDAAAEMRCYVTVFEHSQPGARAALMAWAGTRGLAVHARELNEPSRLASTVSYVETKGMQTIEIFWRR